MEQKALLQVLGLTTYFFSFGRTRIVKAVDQVSFEVHAGDRLALIGESGCGKSTVAASILRVLPPSGETVSGKIFFEGEDLLQKSNQEMSRVRGRKIAMILQINSARMLKPVAAGDTVRVEAEVVKMKSQFGELRGAIYRDGELVADGQMRFGIANAADVLPGRAAKLQAPD
jgi:ABC-type dipeptide/oligopeptide/nickel transport system ATPase component